MCRRFHCFSVGVRSGFAKMRRFIMGMGLVLAVLIAAGVGAQGAFSARLEADDLEPLLGEPFGMTLIVQLPAGYEMVVPTLGPDWGDFSVFEMTEPTIQQQGEAQVYTIEMQVAVWQVDNVETPPLLVEYRAVDGSETGIVPVEPLELRVPSTLDSEPELRISRLTIALPFSRAMLIVAGTAIMVVVVIGGAFALQRYQQRRAAMGLRGGVTSRTLAQQTVQALNRIRSDSPNIIVQYMAMGDTLRDYVERLFDVATEDLTTKELMRELETQESLTRGRQKELEFLLEQADLAKFAPSAVYAPKDLSVLQMAISWVQAVEREVTL